MTGYRERQVKQIEGAQVELAQEKEALIAKKAEKLNVQKAQENEKNELLVDAQAQEKTVATLQSKESELKKDIQKSNAKPNNWKSKSNASLPRKCVRQSCVLNVRP